MVLFRKLRRVKSENGEARSAIKMGPLASRSIFRKKPFGEASTTRPTIQPSLTITISQDEKEEEPCVLTPTERRQKIGPITSSVQNLTPRSQYETSASTERRQPIGRAPSLTANIVAQRSHHIGVNTSSLSGEPWQNDGHKQWKVFDSISSGELDLTSCSQQQAQSKKINTAVLLEREKIGPISSCVQDLSPRSRQAKTVVESQGFLIFSEQEVAQNELNHIRELIDKDQELRSMKDLLAKLKSKPEYEQLAMDQIPGKENRYLNNEILELNEMKELLADVKQKHQQDLTDVTKMLHHSKREVRKLKAEKFNCENKLRETREMLEASKGEVEGLTARLEEIQNQLATVTQALMRHQLDLHEKTSGKWKWVIGS